MAIALFTITASAQDTKTAKKEKSKKESCCMAKDTDAKTMSSEEVANCKEKCKAEGKKCDAVTSKNEGKKCSIKKA